MKEIEQILQAEKMDILKSFLNVLEKKQEQLENVKIEDRKEYHDKIEDLLIEFYNACNSIENDSKKLKNH